MNHISPYASDGEAWRAGPPDADYDDSREPLWDDAEEREKNELLNEE